MHYHVVFKGILKHLFKNRDFSDGFTFEIYTNLERLRYDNGYGRSCSALFCRIPSLDSDYTKAMKFRPISMVG